MLTLIYQISCQIWQLIRSRRGQLGGLRPPQTPPKGALRAQSKTLRVLSLAGGLRPPDPPPGGSAPWTPVVAQQVVQWPSGQAAGWQLIRLATN